jgi:ribosome-binding protein aMBF1 (putative translation factor)
MKCKICGKDTQEGYKVNPRTGHSTIKYFWCKDCYEIEIRRVNRNKLELRWQMSRVTSKRTSEEENP